MKPRLIPSVSTTNFTMGSGNKCERRSGPNHGRRNRFQAQCDQLDSRVLLSTFSGDAGPVGAMFSDVSHLTGAIHINPLQNLKYVGSPHGGQQTTPAAPSLKVKVASANQINLSWNRVSGATSYIVEEWESTGWTQIGTTGSHSTSFSVKGLIPSTTYEFSVGASNTNGTTWSSYQSATTRAQNGHTSGAPSFTATAVSTTEVDLAWTDVHGAKGYLVEEWENGAWTQIANVSSTTSMYAVTGLNSSTTYSFQLGAVKGNKTTWGTEQSATTLTAPPAAPSLTVTAMSASQIDLTWNSVTGATGFVVDEWENGAWTQIANVDGNTTAYSVYGLNANTTYYFDVEAVNSAGDNWASFQGATTFLNVTVNNPASAAGYTAVTGSLFGANGPSYLDVQQGAVGDCWLMASLAEVAARVPSDITNMFTYDGQAIENGSTVGIYTVRFFANSGSPVYVTVDTELPAGGGYYDHPANGVLWVALAEKAYAEANGNGWVSTSNPNSNSYSALNEGYPYWALHAITGNSASYDSVNPGNIASAWNAGQLIVLCTGTPASSNIVASHCYAVVNYDASNGLPFEVYNPWGTTSTGYVSGSSTIYGLFNANGAFLSQNFTAQSIGTGAAPGLDNLGTVSDHAVDLLFAVDPQWFRHAR
jgi:hypothetical protein